MPSWLNDFEFRNKKIYVKATDTELKVNWELASEVLHWLPFFCIEQIRGLNRFFKTKRLQIAYLPVTPRPWYLLKVTANRLGAKTIKNLDNADAIFYFEDQTQATPPSLSDSHRKKAYNFACSDISKSKVGRVFEQIFGYGIAINPETYDGDIAVKSEKNGAHDGYVAKGPIARDPELVYQRLIDNKLNDSIVEDLRCPIIDGEIRLIFIKHRPVKTRFANVNSKVSLGDPEDYLSDEERKHLKDFAKAMGLDWGGMDVLRNRLDGKIYVVDVNKTDMGPPIALSLEDKNRATRILADQLMDMIHPAS